MFGDGTKNITLLFFSLSFQIPELSSGHAHPYSSQTQSDPYLLELGLQMLGMLTGILIMLLIALYEHELTEAFS